MPYLFEGVLVFFAFSLVSVSSAVLYQPRTSPHLSVVWQELSVIEQASYWQVKLLQTPNRDTDNTVIVNLECTVGIIQILT